MPEFVHLHNHSDYSLLDGAASINSLVEKAKSLGMKHLALTDHGNMFGALRFYNRCRKEGINPIVGCEFYVAPRSRFDKSGIEQGNKYHHLILLAKDYSGYKNLIKLSSLGYTEGFYYKPRIDKELMEKYAQGLICTSACLAGEIPSLILNGSLEEAEQRALYYDALFGRGNYYLELQDHGIQEQKTVNPELIRISQKTGIPLVATNDIHYADKEDATAQDILLCIGTNKKKNEQNRLSFTSGEFYLKTQEEMEALFPQAPQAISNTLRIAEQCNLTIKQPGPLLPEYDIPKEYHSPDDYLKALTYKGLEERYGTVTETIKKRADYELDIIISMGFTGYFLIVWDFIHYAVENEIPVGPGRGSGAGSIVAFSLKITNIEPLKYGLLFERFLNPERISMPDFDIDFCFERRQEVIDYVTRKYGKERVGQIITFGTLKAKAAIKDVARVLDFSFSEANELSKLIPVMPGGKGKLKDFLEMEPKLKELASQGENYAELIETSLKLEGLNRHASTHAAGIVIGKEALTNYVPLYRDSKTGSISTQYTMDMLEDCGLVKMDFLGLKTLTLIQNTEKLIRLKQQEFDINQIPDTDKATFDLLGEGKSTCIFQFESSGMQDILRKAKPNKIEDLIALNALYRPGPMANIPQFIDAKWGRAPITYPLPELEDVLKETYGVIVYQEQVMEITRIVAGYTLGQADILRRAMGKKKTEVMAAQKLEFINGAKKLGRDPKKAEQIFDLLIPFAGYGFNKSHAAAYSVLAYQTAYLKANYPAEFMAANLTNEINNTDKLSLYITETREMGLEILKPDINLSDKKFTVKAGKIIYGLMGIKNVGTAAVEEILKAREADASFSSFIDFLERVDLKVVNRRVTETLIQSGLFDSLGENRATLIHNIERAIDFVSSQKEGSSFGQGSLFEATEHQEFHTLALDKMEEWPQLELLRYEKENLGFYFSGHPMDKYQEIWKDCSSLNLANPERVSTTRSYTLVGMVKSIREIFTKTGKKMAFVLIEDYDGSLESIFFSDPWEKYKELILQDRVLGFIGKVDLSRDEPKLKVEEVKRPEELKKIDAREVHIKINSRQKSEEELYDFRSFLVDHQGDCMVFLHLGQDNADSETVIKVGAQIAISSQDHVLKKIKSHPLIESIWKE